MDQDSDGINEHFAGMGRVVLTVAGIIGERMARERQQRQLAAAAASATEGRALEERLNVERAAAKASLAPTNSLQWWEEARAGQVAEVWQTALAWKDDIDLELGQASTRIAQEIQDRYGIDVNDFGGDPAEVRALLAQRELDLEGASAQRRTGGDQDIQAVTLVQSADRADRDANQPADAAATAEAATRVYDSAERRRDVAAGLEGLADEEAIEALLAADTSQAQPATEAVAQSPRNAPSARRSHGAAGAARDQSRRVQRGR